MKKLICLVAIIVLMLSMTACNGKAVKANVDPKFFLGTWTCEESEKSGLITPPTTLVINADKTGTLVYGTEAYEIVWEADPDCPEILIFTSVKQIGGKEIKYEVNSSNQNVSPALLRVTFTVNSGVANLALEDANLFDNMKIGAVLTKDDTNPIPVIPEFIPAN
jgi:hypothetical protein